MKIRKEGTTLHVAVEGALGESSPLYSYPMADLKMIHMDMTNMTYMNSIGVKNWILWTVKIPRECKVTLSNCPLMIASQASQVLGFTNSNIILESIRIPYVCENCGYEELTLATNGTEYIYATATQPSKIALSEHKACPKCGKNELEPDIVAEKTFKFLELAQATADKMVK